MRELPKIDRYFVKRSDAAAWSVMKKMCKNYRPGAVIPVTDEEFTALRKSVIIITDVAEQRSKV